MPDDVHRGLKELRAFRRAHGLPQFALIAYTPDGVAVATRGGHEGIADAISAAVERLPDEEPRIVVLNEFSDKEYGEIARADRRRRPPGDGILSEVGRLHHMGKLTGIVVVTPTSAGPRIWREGRRTPLAATVLSAVTPATLMSPGFRSYRWFHANAAGGFPALREPTLRDAFVE